MAGNKLTDKPNFLWDYDLTETQVRKLLHHAPLAQRRWLAARILERLSVPAVFDYLNLDEIRKILPNLRLDPKVKKHWEEAIQLWTRPTQKWLKRRRKHVKTGNRPVFK